MRHEKTEGGFEADDSVRGRIELQKTGHKQPVPPSPLWIAGCIEKTEIGQQVDSVIENPQVRAVDVRENAAARRRVDRHARADAEVLAANPKLKLVA